MRTQIVRLAVAVLLLVTSCGLPGSSEPSTRAPASFPSALVPTLSAEIPVGEGGISALLFAEGSVWVPSLYGSDGNGDIARVDPGTNDVVARIPVPAVPTWEIGNAGMAAGAGSIWVAGGGVVPGGEFGAMLVRIDPIANEVAATIPLDGTVGYDVSVDESGVWALYAGADNYTRVARIDPATNEVLSTVALDHQWAHWIEATELGVVALEHRTFGDGGRAGVFTIVDPATGDIISSMEPDLAGVSWSLVEWEGQVWTMGGGADLTRLDSLTAAPIEHVRPWLPPSGAGLAVGEGGIWFGGYNPYSSDDQRPFTLNRYNPATRTTDVSAEIDEGGGVLAVGGGAVWFLRDDGMLSRLDLLPPPQEATADDLRPFVAPLAGAFMQARIDGSGAERFMSPGAWDAGPTSLYSPQDIRYEGYEISGVEPLGEASFEVRVRMLGAHLDGENEWSTELLFEELLSVGPGANVTGQQQLLLITGAVP